MVTTLLLNFSLLSFAICSPSHIPAREAGVDIKTCIFSDSPYILSLNWISLSTDNPCVKELFPQSSYTKYNWIQSYLSNSILSVLRNNSIGYNEYSFNTNSPIIKSDDIYCKLEINPYERNSAFLTIDATGPNHYIAQGVMNLRINRPILLHCYNYDGNRIVFLLIELKDNGV